MPAPLSGWRRHPKRVFDLGVGALLLAVLAPLMAMLAALTKLSSHGPILFHQERVGRDGRPFRMLKFRTMHVDSSARLAADPTMRARYLENDFKLPIDEDPRVTRAGRAMRRSSLDELPQLVNVLRGEMSLVGPRPVVARELARYGAMVEAYTSVRPGMTGRWQTEGRNTIRYPERALLDEAYVRHYTLRLDIAILCKTVSVVLGRNGVH